MAVTSTMDEVVEPKQVGPRIKTLLWPQEFEALRELQRSPDNTSPRWDLGDLTSAAVAVALQLPDAAQKLRAQAARRLSEQMNLASKQ